ncbi:S2/P23 family protein (plasmid) [Borrelia miyamotoi]|uniref:S2/P23 family protein n=1 Tax=Borrelia miyamotoi TaxID=47466 RepID=A0AAX3JNA0_9SPIR|nr:S2/P23 family protein [Borrelia miyamotoi]QFP42363.1 S2/P23 family protein [Borrelia miyamotoi]QFP48484.1 S2/P23 family protein [Borrelia miyamotoi]WAZ72386.1 S2/P23 family protein [Borrelia miyamotoi]
MQKIIIILPLFITCCCLSNDFSNIQNKTKKPYTHNKHKLKEEQKIVINEQAIMNEQVTFEILEGTKEKCMCLVCFWCGCPPKCTITWMKIKAKEIIGKDKQPIESLKNKLRFSYSVSPIKYNDQYSKYVMPLILFESLEDNIQVTSFRLKDHPTLNFNNKKILGIQGIPEMEKSSEAEYKNVYPYGILNAISPTGGQELISAFTALYNNGKWNLLEAEITVKDETTQQQNTYTILLNGKLFNEFMKKIIEKYPGTTTANNQFRVPIND